MGHSFGGAFTQLLLDRGLGAAGVAIDSAAVDRETAKHYAKSKAVTDYKEYPCTSRSASLAGRTWLTTP